MSISGVMYSITQSVSIPEALSFWVPELMFGSPISMSLRPAAFRTSPKSRNPVHVSKLAVGSADTSGWFTWALPQAVATAAMKMPTDHRKTVPMRADSFESVLLLPVRSFGQTLLMPVDWYGTCDDSRWRVAIADSILSKMSLTNQRVQVARPAQGNFSAKGIVGTAFPAVGGARFAGLYVLDPDDIDDLDKVETLLFNESELESVPRKLS